MIYVKLLKVVHTEREEARKLIPYIKEADIWCPEYAGLTDDMAKVMEADWEVMIRSTLSRSTFLRKTEEGLQFLPPNQRRYVLGQADYLFQNKVLIWYLERFTPEKAATVHSLKAESNLKFGISLRELGQGQINHFFSEYWESLKLEKKSCELRDQEVARNIDLLERMIPQRYNRFMNKDIQAVVAIGGAHHPERYVSFSLDVVDLSRPAITIPDRLDYALDFGKSFDEMKPLMLAYGALELSLRGVISLKLSDIEKMSYDDLRKKLSR